MNRSGYSNYSGRSNAPSDNFLYVKFPCDVREKVVLKLFGQVGGVTQVINKREQGYYFVVFEKPEYTLFAAKIFNQHPFLGGRLVATPRSHTETDDLYRPWQREHGQAFNFSSGTKYSDLKELDFENMELPGTSETQTLHSNIKNSYCDESYEETRTIDMTLSTQPENGNNSIFISEDEEIILLDQTEDDEDQHEDDDVFEDTKPMSPTSEEDGEIATGESDDDCVIIEKGKDDEEDEEPAKKRRRW